MQSQTNSPDTLRAQSDEKFCCYLTCCKILYSIRSSPLTAAHQGYNAFDDRLAAQQRSDLSFSGQNPGHIINDAMQPLEEETSIRLSVVTAGEGTCKSGNRFFTLLGHGGMGKVIEAKHIGTGELFAVKFSHLLKTVAEDQYKNQNEVLRDKLKEIGILKDNISDLTNEGDNALSPMCLVQIVLTGASDSALSQDIFIMYKHGPSLYDRLISDGTDFNHTNGPAYLQGCAEINQALDFLHVRGLAHVDIKPDNIVQSGTDKNRFIIIDFDNVITTKIMQAMAAAKENTINGTPPYYYEYTLPSTDNDTDTYNELINELQRNDKVALALVLLQVQCWVAAITRQKNMRQSQAGVGKKESNDNPPPISARQRPAENSSMATVSSDITDDDYENAKAQALKAAAIISSNAKKKEKRRLFSSSSKKSSSPKKPLAVNSANLLAAASGSTTSSHALPPSSAFPKPSVVTPPEPLPASPERFPATLSSEFIKVLTDDKLKNSCTYFFTSKPKDVLLWREGISSIKQSLDDAREGNELNSSEEEQITLTQELLSEGLSVS